MQTHVTQIVYPRLAPERSDWMVNTVQTQQYWPAVEQLLDPAQKIELVLYAMRDR